MIIFGLPTYTLWIAIFVAIASLIVSSIVFYEDAVARNRRNAVEVNPTGRIIAYILYVIGLLAAIGSVISLLIPANWSIGNGSIGIAYVAGGVAVALFWILFPLGCRDSQTRSRY